jgi:type I restriction enzyme, S subunit
VVLDVAMLEPRTTHGTLAGSHHTRSHPQLLLSFSDKDCCAYPTPHSPCPGRGQQKPEIVSLQPLSEHRVSLPAVEKQRAIASYLDAETARIDALIAKKQRMMHLISDRRSAIIEQTIRMLVEQCGSTPLKRAVRRIEVGIVVTPAAWYANEGVLALRGLNVRPGRIVLDDVVRISSEGHRFHAKSELRAGDIVVVRTGKAGAAAVIPESLHGCNCIDLVIVRPTVGLIPKFLEFVLNSDWTQKHIDKFSVGTIQSHFNVGAMKELPIPVPSLADQNRAVEDLVLATHKLDQLSSKLVLQVDLLSEHRQALITVAVTGDLDIPGPAA